MELSTSYLSGRIFRRQERTRIPVRNYMGINDVFSQYMAIIDSNPELNTWQSDVTTYRTYQVFARKCV